jgi:hypothetical protein
VVVSAAFFPSSFFLLADGDPGREEDEEKDDAGVGNDLGVVGLGVVGREEALARMSFSAWRSLILGSVGVLGGGVGGTSPVTLTSHSRVALSIRRASTAGSLEMSVMEEEGSFSSWSVVLGCEVVSVIVVVSDIADGLQSERRKG